MTIDDKIVSSLLRDSTREAVDRRRSYRQPIGTVGALQREWVETGGAQALPGLQILVLNVSLHGAGLRSPVAFRAGEVYALRIGAGPLHLSSRCKIVSSRQRNDGQYDVGVEFV